MNDDWSDDIGARWCARGSGPVLLKAASISHNICTFFISSRYRRVTKTGRIGQWEPDEVWKTATELDRARSRVQVASIARLINATRPIATVVCDFGIEIEIFGIQVSPASILRRWTFSFFFHRVCVMIGRSERRRRLCWERMYSVIDINFDDVC